MFLTCPKEIRSAVVRDLTVLVFSGVSSFVVRNGHQLQLDGKPFYFLGTDAYWLAEKATYDPGFVDKFFDYVVVRNRSFNQILHSMSWPCRIFIFLQSFNDELAEYCIGCLGNLLNTCICVCQWTCIMCVYVCVSMDKYNVCIWMCVMCNV